jgi:hypothetical protein
VLLKSNPTLHYRINVFNKIKTNDHNQNGQNVRLEKRGNSNTTSPEKVKVVEIFCGGTKRNLLYRKHYYFYSCTD